ncbi:MAG: aldehyde dehydrogenase family protein [Pseudomonadota bacterium]
MDLADHRIFRRGAFVNGGWIDARDGQVIERVSPGHGVPISEVARCGAAEAQAAVAAARHAFDEGTWPRATAAERSRLLHRTADLAEARLDEIARLDVLESGKPIAQARAEIAIAVDLWRYAAARARDVHGESWNGLGNAALGVVLREPIGVVTLITPWNFPFLILAQKLPFALAAGCTVVVKPSEMTSASTLLMAELLGEAGLPAGVCNVVTGYGPEAGAPLTAHPDVDMVSFTGSTRVGKSTMAAAAVGLKKVAFELGGKNPQLVFADADLEAARDAAVFGAFFNAGQCCNAGSRLLVEASIADTFAAEVAALAKRVVVGDPLAEATQVGAIVSDQQLETIETSVDGARRQGAAVLAGGQRVDIGRGRFMAPTVLGGVTATMAAARDEIFGPVVTVTPFRDEAEAVRIANDVEYGLSAAVWSRDVDTCIDLGRRLRCGTVWVNTFMNGAAELPFGGYRQSGLGRELGRDSVNDYTETKTLHIHTGPRTTWWVRTD